jgi:hypothetical protein
MDKNGIIVDRGFERRGIADVGNPDMVRELETGAFVDDCERLMAIPGQSRDQAASYETAAANDNCLRHIRTLALDMTPKDQIEFESISAPRLRSC